MKIKRYYFIALLLLVFSCSPRENSKILVGVFDINGDSPWCIRDAIEACKIDSDIDVRVISAADIMRDDVNYDVFLFPGGSGSSETSSLGEKGMARIIDMIRKEGKGVVGICAGAYILTKTPNYSSLGLSGYEATDIEHDHRGNGLVKFTLNEMGKEIFPELVKQDTFYCQYYEGPVLVPSHFVNYKYKSLATMHSDVHLVEGTPANMTNNKPFIAISECDSGRVASFVGHPECTPGMRWMVPRLIRWVAKKRAVSYSKEVVRPEIYNREILYDKDKRALMYEYKKALKGSKDEILGAIDKIMKMSPWSAKKWMQGLLRHNDSDVRIAAAKALVELERTDAIIDIEVAMRSEKYLKVKATLERSLTKLKLMLDANK